MLWLEEQPGRADVVPLQVRSANGCRRAYRRQVLRAQSGMPPPGADALNTHRPAGEGAQAHCGAQDLPATFTGSTVNIDHGGL
jgi:hypothetical protein